MKENRELYIAREGWPFIGFSIILCIFAALLGSAIFLMIFVIATLFMVYFFRNPERSAVVDDLAILSPADGKILKIEECVEERHLNGPAKKISIFMSVFNVHVNRVPVSGVIKKISYNPGRFFVASMDKASEANEKNEILIETKSGIRILFVQIAGIIARRIVCYLREGEEVLKGSRFGMIRFGSRVDIYLPLDCLIDIKVGDRVKGGLTVLACLPRETGPACRQGRLNDASR